MSTLVTRSGKGSPLTHNEVDTNFTNLNTDKVEKTSADITGGTINNTTVGATTPSTGVFTTLTAQNETLVGTGQNLFLYSQPLNIGWSKSGTATFTDNSTTAPDGTTTAGLLSSPAVGDYMYQVPTTVVGVSYTFSYYVKNSTATISIAQVRTSSTAIQINLAWSAGVPTPSVTFGSGSVTATSVGSGWYRIAIVYVSVEASARHRIYGGNGTSVAGNVFIWGAQVELGSIANTYIPTTTTAVYGTPTLSFSGVASIGLQSDGSLYETSAGTGNVRFYTNNIAQEQMRVSHTASAVNYVQVTGGATTKGVIESAQGSDSNISYVTQSKGTGAIDLAAGSSGVNISNGGTVTAITRTAQGSNYTSAPSVSISAPTTAGGVQATVSAYLRIFGETLTSGGTGYTVNDIITFVGGTGISTASYRVTSVSVGVITGISLNTAGGYTTVPSNPISVTGGTGTGATITVTNWGVDSVFTITNAGSGYVEQPTVTFSGGGGSGAAAFAVVGSQSIIKGIGTSSGTISNQSIMFQTPSGNSLLLRDPNQATPDAHLMMQATASGYGILVAEGSNANASLFVGAKGSGSVRFSTSGTTLTEQLRVAHTASAVNYVQVTGNATNGAPTISALGSDANVYLDLKSKGNLQISLYTGGGIQFAALHTASAVNYATAKGSATGFGVIFGATGSDTNIPLVLQPKGTGALQAQQTDSTATGGNARGANAVDWQTFTRTSAAQVASGLASSVLGGARNTSGAVASTVVCGTDNTANANNVFVGSGATNFSNGTSSAIVSGLNNTSNGTFAFIGAGQANTTAGFFNVVVGGQTNSATSASAVTTQSATMNGTTAVTLSGSNANIKVGQLITGTSITSASGTVPYTYVAAISGTSLTLSQAASGSSTSTLSFFTPHGVVVGGGNNQATGAYSAILGGGDAGTAANRNVASGAWSTVGGGLKNISSGQGSVIGGGYGNTSSGIGSVIVGGGLYGTIENSQFAVNSASGTSSFIGAGFQNFNSGYAGSIVGGYGNTVNSNWGVASGAFATTRGITNLFAFGAYPITPTVGVSQAALLVLGKQTTDATATVITSDGGAAGSTNQVILPNNSAYYFKVEIIANVTGGGNTSGWELKGVIKRGANAASTAIVGSVTSTLIAQDAGASTWVVSATADTTNGGLKITVTGQASTTIRWVAKASTTEVTF